ncbi:MAG: tetratricopeptide repeat protein [Gammaproteobacteria bacterium]|nr:tetratricopeptide repeat protein [Gammaproteobacteria bacterium]
MLSFDLGNRSFCISTNSKQAQILFDQGLKWCFGFNQEEGQACFTKALEYDAGCAMLHWGIAYAAGPFYNMPWCDFSEKEAEQCTALCRRHIDKALHMANGATALEKALVEALSERVQKAHVVTQSEFDHWDYAYASAMRSVNVNFPDNLDVKALFIEALITRTPWRLWNVRTNTPPPGADTLEALAECESAISLADARQEKQHPAILHLHIHITEMSSEPERAMDSADRLSGLCPDAGHIHHMPGHIYVLCGEYLKAKKVSMEAVRVNRKYLTYAGPYNYYTTARCHDLHLLMYTCMFLGQYQPALEAAMEMCENLTTDVISLQNKPFIANTMEGYFSMKMHVLVRFGKWQEIIDEPLPEDATLYCVSTSMHHYAKGVAYAATGQINAAEEQKELFYQSLEKIPSNRKFFNNLALSTLGVGEMMLLGELEYRKGNYTEAFAYLRRAVDRCDDLHYSEPWPWMHPPRHALGALLLEQNLSEEAEAVYRADLGLSNQVPRCAQHQDNVWALHGLVECLVRRNESQEISRIQKKLNAAMILADAGINSSCCCRRVTS